jgi:hypothetical protein
VFDAERLHALQLAAAHRDMLPAAPWIDTFVMEMSRLGTRLPPAAVVARGIQHWLIHWPDDPKETALSELHTDVRAGNNLGGQPDSAGMHERMPDNPQMKWIARFQEAFLALRPHLTMKIMTAIAVREWTDNGNQWNGLRSPQQKAHTFAFIANFDCEELDVKAAHELAQTTGGDKAPGLAYQRGHPSGGVGRHKHPSPAPSSRGRGRGHFRELVLVIRPATWGIGQRRR